LGVLFVFQSERTGILLSAIFNRGQICPSSGVVRVSFRNPQKCSA